MSGPKENKKLIYILDDDKEICQLYHRYLQDLHFEVQSFYQSETFIQALKLKSPDLCIVDLHLTHHSQEGFLLIMALRKLKGEGLKIVMATASQELGLSDKAYRLGADDFFVKPIDREIFVEKIAALVGTKSAVGGLRSVAENQKAIQLIFDIALASLSADGFRFFTANKFVLDAEFELNLERYEQVIGKKKIRCVVRSMTQETVGKTEHEIYAEWILPAEEKLVLKKRIRKYLWSQTGPSLGRLKIV